MCEYMDRNRTISISILVLFFGTIFMIGMIGTASNHRLTLGTSTQLNDGWERRMDDDKIIPIESLPTRFILQEHTPYTIMTTLPSDFYEAQHILIRTSLSNLTVHLDGSVLYQANFETEKTYASTWHIINIPQESAGSTLSITLDTPYDSMRGIINEISYGDFVSLYTQIIRDFGMRFALGLITLFIGITFVLTSLILRREDQYTIYLGVFAILFSLWLISESRILQFIIGNPNIIGSLSYVSIALFPLPVTIYARSVIVADHKRFFSIAIALFILNTLLVTLLHFSGIATFFVTVPVSMALLVITITMMLVVLLIEYKRYRNNTTKRALIIFSILAFFSFIEVIVFSLSDFRRTSDFAVMGLVIILVVIFIGLIQFSFQNYKGSLERTLYEKLAYTDQLTGAPNRFAYFKDIETIKQLNDHPCLRFIYFDLDKLKTINDNFGHSTGDHAIQNAYNMIESTFSHKGKCYRMGGDEFVCIIEETDDISFNKDIDLFSQRCLEFDTKTDYRFNVSIGSAVYNADKNQTLTDILRQSDEMMYQHKQSKR